MSTIQTTSPKTSKILLDTNILLSIFELKLDILDLIDKEFGVGKYFTVSLVKNELKKLPQKEAKMALKILEKVPIVEYDSDKHTDDALIDYCVENGCILATQDMELKRKAKHKHLKILAIRQQKYLMLEN
jgi:rRNA-processing protein FCF1